MTLSRSEYVNLTYFLNRARSVCQRMMRDTRYPELQVIYSRILENLNHVPINIKPGEALGSEGLGTVFGENVKKMDGGLLKSAIRIPREHLFDESGRIRLDGGLTLLHEMSNVVLPHSAWNFTARVGLDPFHTDELFADLLSAHVAKNIGYRTEEIARHLRQRRSYFNFPIDRLAIEGRRGVAKEIEAGRFIPRTTRRPQERDPIRAPEEPVHIMPAGRRWINDIPGVRKQRPKFSPRFA